MDYLQRPVNTILLGTRASRPQCSRSVSASKQKISTSPNEAKIRPERRLFYSYMIGMIPVCPYESRGFSRRFWLVFIMVEPKFINVHDKQVIVKLMDDSWIINRCAGSHPFEPIQGVVWKHSDQCTRLPIPGDELPPFMSEVRQRYGNCAAIAWYDDLVLGHIVFLPRMVARQKHATGWEHFGSEAEDKNTLVVINLAFCSLSGHQFRRKGIGKALVGLMIEWAAKANYNIIEVYDTEPGLFPVEWLDHCIPPKPFWEGRGFKVFARHPNQEYLSKRNLEAIMADNPRNSIEEQKCKADTVAKIRQKNIDIASYSFRYDLRLVLQTR